MEYSKLIKERYSVRKFSDKNVSQELLDKILEAGRIAPTAKNNQPQHIYVIQNDALDLLGDAKKMTYGAPVCLLCCYDSELVWNSPYVEGYNSGEMDVSIVCTHMMLEACNQGLGSCWIKLFDPAIIARNYKLENNIKPVCLLMIGYPMEDSKPSHLHDSKKDIESLVTYIN